MHFCTFFSAILFISKIIISTIAHKHKQTSGDSEQIKNDYLNILSKTLSGTLVLILALDYTAV